LRSLRSRLSFLVWPRFFVEKLAWNAGRPLAAGDGMPLALRGSGRRAGSSSTSPDPTRRRRMSPPDADRHFHRSPVWCIRCCALFPAYSQARQVPNGQDDKGDESGVRSGHTIGRSHAPHGGARALRDGLSCRCRARLVNEYADVRCRCGEGLRPIHGASHAPSQPPDRVAPTAARRPSAR